MENVYLGRQPILEDGGKIFAYEILYRDSKKENAINDDRYASALVINSVLNKFGTRSLLGERKAFVKVDEKFLMHDLIFSIPNEFFVFCIFEDIELSERVIERIQQLYAKKYLLAINDTILHQDTINKYAPVFKELSYIKVDLDNDKELDADIQNMISLLRKEDIKVIGSKIEDASHYQKAKEYGCDFFEGYFFAKPNIVQNAKYEPTQMNILKLYNMLMTDTNIDEITSEFEKNHEVTIQLLQFINSGAFHFRNRISSIHHILTLIGRRPLSQWLMLMIYSKSLSKGKATEPLMLMVKNRTNLMESILKAIEPNVKSNMLGEAYFVGVLSLIDTIFGMELVDILEQMHISDEVKDALLRGKGKLGEIYMLVRDIEVFNTEAMRIFEERYKLKSGCIKDLVVESIEDVNSFENVISNVR